ncbi:MAG: hypothetical protein EOP33_03105 [Rickettsiaceae bacterium]|nr:MAG: hypothetical protein EOP33_03105 [Rickettsiaceae bacterium]
MAQIELREFAIQVLGMQLATHQYLVKYDDDGRKVELHGVAVFPNSDSYNGIAIGKGNLLKVAIYPNIDSCPDLVIDNFYGLFIENQNSRVIFDASQKEVDARWHHAIKAGNALNKHLNIKYELSGGRHTDLSTGNSNSITTTLEQIMGFIPFKISKNTTVPGLGKDLSSLIEYISPWSSADAERYTPDRIDFLGQFVATIATKIVDFQSYILSGIMYPTNSNIEDQMTKVELLSLNKEITGDSTE